MKFNSYFTILLFTAIAFVACENEPLEGEFISDDPQDYLASFTAEVEGTFFEANTSNAVTVQGVTTVTGIRANGDVIVLNITGVGVGNFDLVTQGEATFGITQDSEAFSTKNQEGQGQVIVTQYDTNLGLISGTFSFKATRPLLDANGSPILDGDGNPTFASVIVSEGQFTNIPLTSDGSGPTDPVTEFYAEVDGIPFVAGEETAEAFYDEATNTLTIQGVNTDKTIRMKVLNVAEGVFDLGATNGAESMGFYLIEGENPYTSEVSEGGSGSVTITTFDLENNTISGTFEFTAGRDGGAETVVIENGYFENLSVTVGGNQTVSDFYADINGVPFTPGGGSAKYFPNLSSIDIEGFIPNSIEMIRLRVQDPGVGTFVFGPDINDTFGMYIKPGTYMYSTNLYPDGEGSVTITTFDLVNNVISGTFEFFAVNDADETVDVTNGSFNNLPIIIN